mmetsp:Transcript_32947/g.95087  ORF Transcript_32947/g.95087 Transcript_32947/m.95087 type:complete len:232 (+) Transcript_32947:381-1076(+)
MSITKANGSDCMASRLASASMSLSFSLRALARAALGNNGLSSRSGLSLSRKATVLTGRRSVCSNNTLRIASTCLSIDKKAHISNKYSRPSFLPSLPSLLLSECSPGTSRALSRSLSMAICLRRSVSSRRSPIDARTGKCLKVSGWTVERVKVSEAPSVNATSSRSRSAASKKELCLLSKEFFSLKASVLPSLPTTTLTRPSTAADGSSAIAESDACSHEMNMEMNQEGTTV